MEYKSRIDGISLYYPEKKVLFFWFKMCTGRSGRWSNKIYYKDSLQGAIDFIENYRKKSGIETKYYYL